MYCEFPNRKKTRSWRKECWATDFSIYILYVYKVHKISKLLVSDWRRKKNIVKIPLNYKRWIDLSNEQWYHQHVYTSHCHRWRIGHRSNLRKKKSWNMCDIWESDSELTNRCLASRHFQHVNYAYYIYISNGSSITSRTEFQSTFVTAIAQNQLDIWKLE